MSKPRNPRYFPQMKVRGAQRRQKAPVQYLLGAFDRLSTATAEATDAFVAVRLALRSAEQGTPTEGAAA